jgi:hypothetical protein
MKPGNTCTITETATGGATNVAYSCQDDGINASCSGSGNEVTFDSPDKISNNVTFTVSNTFAEPTPPASTAPAPPKQPGTEATPASAVAGAPRLTG